jgi:hypothetical protein
MMGRIKGGEIRLGWHGGRTSDVGPVSAIHGWLMMACDDLKFVCYVCMMNSFVHAPPGGLRQSILICFSQSSYYSRTQRGCGTSGGSGIDVEIWLERVAALLEC